jgi:hypothetical protein
MIQNLGNELSVSISQINLSVLILFPVDCGRKIPADHPKDGYQMREYRAFLDN